MSNVKTEKSNRHEIINDIKRELINEAWWSLPVAGVLVWILFFGGGNFLSIQLFRAVYPVQKELDFRQSCKALGGTITRINYGGVPTSEQGTPCNFLSPDNEKKLKKIDH